MKGNLVRLLQEGSDLEKMIQLTLAVEIVDTFVPGLFIEKRIQAYMNRNRNIVLNHKIDRFPLLRFIHKQNRLYFDNGTF